MNTPISALLEQKQGALYSVQDNATVAEAVREMINRRVGCILVMHGAHLVGIFTERDVLSRVVGQNLDATTTPITKVMSGNVLTIEPETTVQEVMKIFIERRCRHLPVTGSGGLHGMISIGDVSRWVSSHQRAEAESLRQYISGGFTA